MTTLDGNRPNVFQMVYNAKTERTTVSIGDNPNPDEVTYITSNVLLKTFSEFDYYFNALVSNIGLGNVGFSKTFDGEGRLLTITIGKDSATGPTLVPIAIQDNRAEGQKQLAGKFLDNDNFTYVGFFAFGPGDTIETFLNTNIPNNNLVFQLQEINDGNPLANFDVYFYNNGVEVSTLINQTPGNLDCPPFAFDTIVLIATGGPAPNPAILVKKGLSTDGICSLMPSPVYTNDGSLAIGKVVYDDAALTTPLLAIDYIVKSTEFASEVWQLNTATGEIIADTGLTCGG
jgi:hypothetical protein